ncbi:MAG: DNA-processing protein DprA [bacterium]|nr:DNA-processing protein DprA [bacterium]MCY3653043.1 DNA-processing protein DprA [bacterium]MDE0644418.1 DNA-processing protein DprA [bacterium]
MTYDQDALIRLAHVGMHPDRIRTLVRETGSPDWVLDRIRKGRVKVKPEARAAAEVPAEKRRESLHRAGIRFLSQDHPDYPARLRDLPDAPLFLFQRGNSFKGEAVAVVGTRSCTTYGRRLAERYGEAISRAGWAVVSGLARGIDGAAHQGSLHGPTSGVAVLGSGVDVWYPRSHRKLGERLLEAGGTIWSEAPPGARPLPWRFPPRNRIISGIAHALIVVEAGVKGGALVTARIALDQNRDIFATPGDVGRASSMGCNLLIRDGAHPVLDADDLLECLELAIGPPPRAQNGSAPSAIKESAVSVEQFVASLSEDPIKGMAEMGRLIAQGQVSIDSYGMVVRAGGGGQ